MPDILIRGMEMPDEQPVTLLLDPSGRVWMPDIETGKEYMAQELPPHGDLIDRDAIKYVTLYGAVLGTTEPIINEQPVIVPAEKGETQ